MLSHDFFRTHVSCFFVWLSNLSNWGVMDGFVTNAYWSIGGNASDLKYPWETGPQAGVFTGRKRIGDDQIFDRKKPRMPEFEPTSQGSHEPFAKGASAFDVLDECKPLYTTCVKALAVRTYEEDRDNKSKLAIRKWRLILSNNYGATKIGRDIHDEILIGSSDEFIDEMIVDVFGVKSPNTLLKRAGSIMKYLYWHCWTLWRLWFPFERKSSLSVFQVPRSFEFRRHNINVLQRGCQILQAHYGIGECRCSFGVKAAVRCSPTTIFWQAFAISSTSAQSVRCERAWKALRWGKMPHGSLHGRSLFSLHLW